MLKTSSRMLGAVVLLLLVGVLLLLQVVPPLQRHQRRRKRRKKQRKSRTMTWCVFFFFFFSLFFFSEQGSNIDDVRRVLVSSIDCIFTTTLCCYFLVPRSYYTPGIWCNQISFFFSVGVNLRGLSRMGTLSPHSSLGTAQEPDYGTQRRFGQSPTLFRTLRRSFSLSNRYLFAHLSPGTSCTHSFTESPFPNPEEACGPCPPYRERLDTSHVTPPLYHNVQN